ncbi:ATP-binding protein [Streptomyces sp. BHT-5-2]|uniref:ATP-binding protein n=1 Tax=unclassified Streptomyces TaxID=2593676 RepID=UPI001C8E905F|nr:ATP-binding protein [Streptomyces sp. BHT-5-2]QZL05263.1 ATP-binding protein [Streptomyces sp. BHT-5-2]
MPLDEQDWQLVTTWLERYLLNVGGDPYSRLAPYFPHEFLAAIPLNNVIADNARTLVHASRRTIELEVQLLDAVTQVEEIRALPVILQAEEFLARLREDARIHDQQDVFRSCVLQQDTGVFIGREDLRETLRGFIATQGKSVLLVDGVPGSGRSYTYQFLRHLGWHKGFRPARVGLSRMYTGRQVLLRLAEYVVDPRDGAQWLGPALPGDDPPTMADIARRVIRLATTAEPPYWLVLDDCDTLDPHSDVWEVINDLANAIYEQAPAYPGRTPRLVLLGYGRTTSRLPDELQGILCWDTARIIDPPELRRFFEQCFRESPPARLDGADPAEIDGLVDEAVAQVLYAARSPDDDGANYMRRVRGATEKAIHVYRSL